MAHTASARPSGCVIGPQITVRGTLTGEENLLVEGRVEGGLSLSGHLVVAEGGVVSADIDVESIEVHGEVEGDIVASHSVTIERGATVRGNVRAPRVIIVDGASFRGRIDMGEINVEGAERPALARASSRPALRSPPRGAIGRSEDEEEAPAESAALAERASAAMKPPPPPVPVAMGAVKRKVIVRRK